MIFGKIEVINMNFYGSEEYNQLIKELDKLVYTKCNLLKSTNEVELDDEYSIKYYYYKDIDSNKDGEICRLYKDEKMIYEWKNIYNISRYATIIKHSDGNKYLLFSIDLYGYSVLNLKTLECINYIPSESYLDNKETFIWTVNKKELLNKIADNQNIITDKSKEISKFINVEKLL